MELEGVKLSGFDFGYIDHESVNKILGEHLKLMKRNKNFVEIDIHLKKKSREKSDLYEIRANAKAGRLLSACASGFNIYKALSEALEKINNELNHIK